VSRAHPTRLPDSVRCHILWQRPPETILVSPVQLVFTTAPCSAQPSDYRSAPYRSRSVAATGHMHHRMFPGIDRARARVPGCFGTTPPRLLPYAERGAVLPMSSYPFFGLTLLCDTAASHSVVPLDEFRPIEPQWASRESPSFQHRASHSGRSRHSRRKRALSERWRHAMNCV
jgi:hypothetical protein